MPPVEFPARHVPALHDAAARLIESRRPGTELKPFARHVLLAFHEVCLHFGLDRVLEAFAAIDDREALADHESIVPALVAQLETIDLDGGGPRNVKPGKVATCVIAALGLNVVEEADRAIAMSDGVRAEVSAALTAAIAGELAPAAMRETIIADARTRCDERFASAFNKVTAQLDERGIQLLKQPKVPIDAMQAIQQALFAARAALVDRIGRAAIDRAQDVLARATDSADAAARIDQPVTLRLTPRDVAIWRASQARVPKEPAFVARALLDALTEVVPIAWQAAERVPRPYAASQTFAIGDYIEHPKFGRGTVTSALMQRIDVEFDDGVHTLVHVPPRR